MKTSKAALRKAALDAAQELYAAWNDPEGGAVLNEPSEPLGRFPLAWFAFEEAMAALSA